jgi:predicted nucleic acid-binding protein
MRVLGPGESAAIVLAKELTLPLLLDECEARSIAVEYGWDRIIGTCTVLLEAKKTGAIAQVRPIIDALLNANYRLNRELIEDTLRRASE